MSTVLSYLPIRKLVMVAVGSGLTWGAQRAGLDLGTDALNTGSAILVGLAFGYAEKDPRVMAALKAVEDAAEANAAKPDSYGTGAETQ